MPLPPSAVKKCCRCGATKPKTEFYRRSRGDKLYGHCVECHLGVCLRYLNKNPQNRLHHSSLNSARIRGHEHAIQPSDIPLPEKCVYLGLVLNYTTRSNRDPAMATVDRIDTRKGYVVGNVQVISHLANRMKSNATLEQLATFAENVLRLHGK